MVLATNRSAFRNYEISDRWEAGIKLTGPEVKSAKLKRVSLRGSYIAIVGGEAFVLGMQVSSYPKADSAKQDPKRSKKLLLSKKEIDTIRGKISAQGWAAVPLKLYTKNNLIKLEIGVGKGKKKYDKRRDLKKKDIDREVQRELRGR